MSKRKAPAKSKAASLVVKEDLRDKLFMVSYVNGNAMAETVVSHGGYFQFLQDLNGIRTFTPTISNGTKVIYPVYGLKTLVTARAARFPSGIVDYGTQDQLIRAIKAFFKKYASFPDDWLEIVVHYVLMTWVYDRFTAVPYLRFLGEPGTGKTRYLQLLAAVCYKALVASGNITGAALFRTINLMQGTFIVDEAEFSHSEEWSDVVKILNGGYTPDTPVIRCNVGSFYEPEAFRIYGPKIISNRNRFSDGALESRCITFETKEEPVPDHIPLQLPPSFDEEALVLRNKLLGWRFDNFSHINANEEYVRDLEPRLGQIGASLCAVAGDDETMGRLIEFMTAYSEAGKDDSPKAVVVQALAKMRTAGSLSVRVGDIAREAGETAREMDLEGMTPKRVGMILRSVGFLPKRTKRGFVVVLDKAKVDALSARFAVKDG